MSQTVRIFKPAKTAMQSGRAKTHQWVLEFEPASKRAPEPLMGWTSSADTSAQVRLRFETLAEALAFADAKGLMPEVQEAHEPTLRIKSYADNFRPDRIRT